MSTDPRLFAFGAAALAVAAAAGFGVARLTAPAAPPPGPSGPGCGRSGEPEDPCRLPCRGRRDPGDRPARRPVREIRAAATVHPAPDAEAVAAAGAAGTLVRVTKRLGDAVKAGETLALVSSRDAAAIAADRTVAEARADQARKAAERERRLNAEGVSPRQDLEAAEAASRAPAWPR